MKLKWYGTAAIMLEQDGTKLLFDPFLSRNAGAFKPPVEELSEADGILATHGHLDHIADIPAIISRGDCRAGVFCTARPRETLIMKGVPEAKIRTIAPGDVFVIGPFEVSVLRGKHIVNDFRLIVRTFLSPRIPRNLSSFRYLAKENRSCPEGGETVMYDIKARGARALLMGSMNLDERTEYPKGADLLVLPFQGRSDIGKCALRAIERLRPKKVLLDHFDDSFPPISSAVDVGPFVSLMQSAHPGVPVICPQAGAGWYPIPD